MGDLLGVVLCGGKSTRMGRDKGLIEVEGKPWAVLTAEKISSFQIPVVISVNSQQVEEYSKIFNLSELVVDDLKINGPLEGLLSVHKIYQEKDILLLACDLIDMDKKTMAGLLNTYSEEPGYDFYAYEQHGFSQPFCAIYTARGLSEIFKRFEAKEIKKYSLHDRFEEGNTKFLPLGDSAAFNNYNSAG